MFRKRNTDIGSAETLTVGDCLRRRREEMGISLKEIGLRLGVKIEYLESLENGEYENLPPQVYVRGFLKSYASLLGIDAVQAVKMYNREVTFMERDLLEDKKEKKEKIRLRSFIVITPKLVTVFLSVAIFSVLFYYLYHQINSFNSKPYLFIESPSGDAIVNEKDLLVSGYTEKGAVLRINGQEIGIDSSGYFKQIIVLSEGKNFLVIESVNRFNKNDRREFNIIYEKTDNSDAKIQEVLPNESVLDKVKNEPGGAVEILEEKD